MTTLAPTRRQSPRRFACGVGFAALLGLAAGFTGCDDTSDQFQEGNNGQMVVTPTVVTFSQLTPGETATQTVIVSNVGEGTLVLPFENYDLSGDTEPFFYTFAQDEEGVGTETIPQGGEAVIFIDYTQPPEQTEFAATLRLEASNGNVAEVEIRTVRPAPLLQVTPNPVIFSGVTPGTTEEMSVNVSNQGTADLQLTNVLFELLNTTDFTTVSGMPEGETVLAPSESFDIVVRYSPDNRIEVDDLARLSFFGNLSGTDGQVDVDVIGTVAGPRIEVEPAIVDFGAVEKDVVETRMLTVRNIGTGTLDVSAIYLNFDSSTDFSYSDVDTLTLAEGAETTISVSYEPTDAGSDSGFLIFESNDIIAPGVKVALTGAWAGPDLVVKPKLLDFGQVAISVTKTLSFDIFNEGTLPLDITAFNETDFPGMADLSYVVTTGETIPFSIEGGGKRTVEMTFSPTVEIPFTQAYLEIVSNDPEGPSETVEVRFQGLPDGNCVVQLLPTELNFGLVPGGYNATQAVGVKNIGAAPCRIDSASLTPDFTNLFYPSPFAFVNPAWPVTIPPGDTHFIEINYAPFSGETDNFAAQLPITITDVLSGMAPVSCPSATFSFPPTGGGCSFGFGEPGDCWACVFGTTGDPALAAVPGVVDFGLTTLGCSSPNTRVRIYNKGTAPTDIVDVRLAPNCPAAFALTGVPVLPFTLNAGNFQEIEVIFTPATTAAEQCNLIVDGTTETLSIPLTGEGTTEDDVTDIFDQVSGRKVDVLFVIDNSGSMGDEQSNLASNFSSFIQTALTWNVDFNIGVTSTDDADEGELQSRGGHPRIIRSSALTDAEVQAAFSANIQLGTSGSATERGLKAAELALSDPNITQDVPGDCPGSPNSAACAAPYSCNTIDNSCGGHNARFLRDDASLEVIFVSDEHDQSPAVLSFYVDFFKNIKGFQNDALFHAHSIVGFEDNGGNCDMNGFSRYEDIANATGGEFEPLCSAFAQALANIGNNAFGLRVQFFLSRSPDPATIRVSVNGVDFPVGWWYDSSSNGVVFDAPPPENAIIQVDYKAACY